MNESFKKLVLFSVGAFTMTRDKIEELVGELRAEGALDVEEGEKLVREVMEQVDERTKVLRAKVKAEVVSVLDEMGMTAADRANVEEKVTEAVIEDLEEEE